MKKAVVILASCALFAPLAPAQTQSTSKKQGATTAEPITVTGKIVTTSEDGAATNYQPFKTLLIREDKSNRHGKYVLNGSGHVVTKTGELVQTAVRPGARVRVYYTGNADQRVIDHIVVLD
jgi:hypothetical protein